MKNKIKSEIIDYIREKYSQPSIPTLDMMGNEMKWEEENNLWEWERVRKFINDELGIYYSLLPDLPPLPPSLLPGNIMWEIKVVECNLSENRITGCHVSRHYDKETAEEEVLKVILRFVKSYEDKI